MIIKEEFLYNIWQFKRWDSSKLLKSTDGETIEVISPGIYNTNAGPDFFNAKVKIDEVLWVGNVEIHTRSSDWFLHGHETDSNYQNIILHVVYQNNLKDPIANFPTLELEPYLDKTVINQYAALMSPYNFIPCENLLASVPPEIISTAKTALIIEKWEEKEQELAQRLNQLAGDWEQLLFERIAYSFGLKINAEAFLLLAKTLDVNILNSLNLFQKEALIFGQAGFLKVIDCDYQEKLKDEYNFLKNKWGLIPLDQKLFKFLRLRPSNFPTIRLAQWASFLNEFPQIFSDLKNKDFYNTIANKFYGVKASKFWDNHYTFKKESSLIVPKQLSEGFIQKLLINAFLPVHVFYLKSIGKDINDLLDELEGIPVESNSVINFFKALKIPVNSALDSQSLLFLEKNYCKQKKCLNCKIGNYILNNHVR